MRHFAERGYHAARIEDIAARASGSPRARSSSTSAARRASSWPPTSGRSRRFRATSTRPPAVVAAGFFATLRYWLERTEHLLRENLVPYRLTLLGNYGSDLGLRREINRFLAREDPYGTVAFVRMGVERGEVRRDMDAGDRGLDARVDGGALPGRAPDRGAVSRVLPPPSPRPRAAEAPRIDEFLAGPRGGDRKRRWRAKAAPVAGPHYRPQLEAGGLLGPPMLVDAAEALTVSQPVLSPESAGGRCRACAPSSRGSAPWCRAGAPPWPCCRARS